MTFVNYCTRPFVIMLMLSVGIHSLLLLSWKQTDLLSLTVSAPMAQSWHVQLHTPSPTPSHTPLVTTKPKPQPPVTPTITPMREGSLYAPQRPKPHYPKRAKRLGQEGTVILTFLIATNGHVINIQIAHSSGYSLLDKEAISTVSRWKFNTNTFKPRMIQLPITFQLK